MKTKKAPILEKYEWQNMATWKNQVGEQRNVKQDAKVIPWNLLASERSIEMNWATVTVNCHD